MVVLQKDIPSKSPAWNFIIVIHVFKGYWQFFFADMSSVLLRSSVVNEIVISVDGDQMHSGCSISDGQGKKKCIQSYGPVKKIQFQGSSWGANAPSALVHQLLMCREATKYGSTLMCECKAAAPENRQTCSTCPLQNNESNLCVTTEL